MSRQAIGPPLLFSSNLKDLRIHGGLVAQLGLKENKRRVLASGLTRLLRREVHPLGDRLAKVPTTSFLALPFW